MHLKVFLKLKKPLKTLSSGQIYEKKPKKTTGLGFLKNPGFFQPCFKGVPYAEYLKHIASVHKNAAGKFPCPQNGCQAGGDFSRVYWAVSRRWNRIQNCSRSAKIGIYYYTFYVANYIFRFKNFFIEAFTHLAQFHSAWNLAQMLCIPYWTGTVPTYRPNA